MTTQRKTISQKENEQVRGILDRIEKAFQDRQPLIDRMDNDYDRYLVTAPNADEWDSDREGFDVEDLYQTNLDRVLADKVANQIAGANRIIRVPNGAANEGGQIAANDNLEYLAIGFFDQANERLRSTGDQLGIQEQSGWFAPVRGKAVAIRSLLIKDPAGQTVPTMLPLDPRNLVWKSSDNGILWAAYRMVRTREALKDQYPDFKFTQSADPMKDRDDPETVYDYFFWEDKKIKIETINEETGLPEEEDRTVRNYMNGTIVDKQWARKAQNLFTTQFPIIIRAVGTAPFVAPFTTPADENLSSETIHETEADAGDSILGPTRTITPMVNRVMSYNISSASKINDPPYVMESIDGETSPDENPLARGAETPLSTARQDKVLPMPPGDIGVATQTSLGQTLSDWSAGGLSAQALAGTPPPGGLSAAALRQLGGSISEKTAPYIRPVESMLQAALEVMIEQFETGTFAPINVFGKTFSNDPFERLITPEEIQGHGRITVDLVQIIPTDEALAWSTAQIAITPNAKGDQLADVEYAREHILKMPDSRLVDSRINVRNATAQAPFLALKEAMESAMARGEMDEAEYIFGKMKQVLMQEQLEQMALQFQFAQLVGGPGGMQAAASGMGGMNASGGNGAAPGGPGGVSPTIAPDNVFNEAAGTQPSPNAGANSTNPRGGEEAQRLAEIGLVRG